MLRELEARAREEYKKASEGTQRKLNQYLEKYKEDLKRQREKLAAGTITEEQYKNWVIRKVAIGKRWEEMRDNLADDYHNVNMITRQMVYDKLPEAYALNMNFAVYQAEHAALADIKFTLYDRDTAERIIRDEPDLFPPPGRTRAARIAAGKDVRWNRQQVNSAVLQSILQGDTIDEAAKRLENVTEKNQAAAIRNIRTAMTGAQNAGRQEGYKLCEEKGIDLEQEWMATLDGRTRHEHRMLHGQRRKLDEPFQVDGYGIRFPGDPTAPGFLVYNCRCTLVAAIKGVDYSRVEYSPKMGEMTFEEWQRGGTRHKRNTDQTVSAALDNYLKDDSSDNRKKMGESILNQYQVGGVSVKVRKTERGERGYCLSSVDDNSIFRTREYILNADDSRPVNYKVKTSFHEAYHASANGKLTDLNRIPRKDWDNIEETFAECSAIFMCGQYGITELEPTYPDIMIDTLAKLKKTPEYMTCKTVSDFGRMAFENRVTRGEGSRWRDLAATINAVEHDHDKYVAQYFTRVKENPAYYVGKYIEASGKNYGNTERITKRLTDAMETYEQGGKIPGKDQRLVDSAVAMAMSLYGVK